MVQYLETEQGRRIAYYKTEGQAPCVVFLGGLKSDTEGTKAVHLEAWAKARGQAFLRFDYSGHGQSSEDFADGCIGDWQEDAFAAGENYFPEALAHKQYYFPVTRGLETKIKEKLDNLRQRNKVSKRQRYGRLG